MLTVHVKNLDKYQPGYTDRKHIWAKIYFEIFLDPAVQKLDEINRHRFYTLIVFEVYLQGKPLVLTPSNLNLMGWNTKKRSISLTLQMLHTLVIVRNGESELYVTQSRVEESRVEENRIEESKKESVIFNHWNSYRGKGNWKSHHEMTFEIKSAIRDQLKHYTLEQLKKAIDNYAKVLFSKDYQWSYAWTLRQFLTRHQKAPNQQDLQLYRFLESGFADDDYLTQRAREKRAGVRVSPDSGRQRIRDEMGDWLRAKSKEALLSLRKSEGSAHYQFLIDEILKEKGG